MPETRDGTPYDGETRNGTSYDAARIPEEVVGGTPDRPTPITPALLRQWPLPEPSGSKYSRGQVLVVGGARSTPGAAMLAGAAALRMGAGRLSIAVAESIAPHVAVAMPECGTVALPEDGDGAVTGENAAELLRTEVERADAILIGPGLTAAEGSTTLLSQVVSVLPDDTPVVLDAFGLTVLPSLPQHQRARLAGRVVLTPNTGELRRIIDRDQIDDDQVVAASLEAADRYGAVVGCATWIVAQGRVWQVTTGDTGLGTSGSGDVVAGAVVGLLSRGAGLTQALAWGKYVHAAAGDALAMRFGRIGFLAGEVSPQLPLVLRSLRGD